MKHLANLSIAIILILFALPLMGIVAVAIKLESPGPVLSRCSRICRDGRRFELLRFRTTQLETSKNLAVLADL
jgi:lipopolysaccharide/colanic/teichoic acid biosynthesis glycosyltransferase